jgi:hypothetical protein
MIFLPDFSVEWFSAILMYFIYTAALKNIRLELEQKLSLLEEP